MHIYLSCLQSIEKHPIPAYEFWEPYFKRGIEEGGHRWSETPGVDWAEGLALWGDPARLAAWRERTWSVVVDDLRHRLAKGPVDFFLGYLYPHQVERSAIEEIQRLGIPCVNFFCDNVREFAAVPPAYGVFDLHWVPEYKAMPMYQRAGFAAINAPMPTWVDPAARTCAHEERFGPTFIGSRDIQREGLFARAIALGAPVELRGPGWASDSAAAAPRPRVPRPVAAVLRDQVDFARSQGAVALARKIGGRFGARGESPSFDGHVAPPAFGADYVRVTQQSSITLGVNRYPSFRHPASRPDTYSRLRDIEAPMLGACYLTEWTEGLDELYDLGAEIETYRTPEEMVEKIAALQADSARRATMRCQAQRRALSQHSVARSVDAIGERLGVHRA